MIAAAPLACSSVQPPERLTETVFENTYTDMMEGTVANSAVATRPGKVLEAAAAAALA